MGLHKANQTSFKKGQPGFWTGKKRGSPSAETLRKRSESMKGKNTWAKGRKHTLVQRLAKSKRQMGKNASNWQGGKTAELKKVRNSFEYKLWRTAVFERDDYTCRFCSKRGGNMQADHIKPFAYYPELRFAIDNGRTLCVECHRTTDTYSYKANKHKDVYGKV